MDIKSAPATSAASLAANGPTGNTNSAFLTTNALPQFLIRTMKGDLAAAGVAELKISPPAKDKLRFAEKKKEAEEQEEIARIRKNQRKKELAQMLEIAKLQTEKGVFEKEEDLKKILAAPEAGWWLKWKTGSLLKKIEKAKERKSNLAAKTMTAPIKAVPSQIKIEPKTEIKTLEKTRIDLFKPMAVSPPPSPPKITASPPAGLPIAELPVFPPKTEIKPFAAMPEPAKLAAPIIPPTLQAKKAAMLPIELPQKIEAPKEFAPPAPAKPLVPVKLSPKAAPTPKGPFPAKLVLGAIILVIVFAIGGLIYFFSSPGQPGKTPTPTFSASPLPSETPSPSPQILITPLFEMGEKITLKIKSGENNLFTLLKNSAASDRIADSFSQIFIENKDGKIMNLEEIASSFFPEFLALENASSSISFKNSLDPENFTLFAFWEKQTNFSPFEPTQNQPKLGLVVKLTKAAKKTELGEILKSSEPNLPALLKNILPGSAKTDSPAVFASNNDQPITLRYYNFISDGSLSIDYALTNDLLLITTSKQSAYSALKKIAENNSPAPR